MPRTINVTVSGQFVKKDSKNAGVMGEGNVTSFRVTFDDSWSGYGKRIVWRNANGGNPISVVLFDPSSGQETAISYVTKIPAEPLEFPGWCSFTLEGYKDEDGEHSVSFSVSDHLLVEESDGYNKPAEPTPSLAQQVMEELGKTEEVTRQNVTESKSWAVGGTGFREGEDSDNSRYYSNLSQERSNESAESARESSEYAESSKESRDESEKFANESQQHAEESNRAKQSILNMSVSAETVSPFDEARAEKGTSGDRLAIKFYIPQGYSGATVEASGLYGFHVDEDGYLVLSYTGDNPPAFRIDENGNLIYTINDQDVNIGHVVVDGGGGSGTPGKAATIQIGTTSTGEPGSNAQVVNVGTENDAILNFVIPRGDRGPTGATPDISVRVTGLPYGSSPTVSESGTPEAPIITLGIPAGRNGDPGTPGTNGEDGKTPNITIGEVETLPAGSNATASITGETPNLTLNLGIPRGADSTGGGSVGTTDYNALFNKPQINGVPLSGNLTGAQLGLEYTPFELSGFRRDFDSPSFALIKDLSEEEYQAIEKAFSLGLPIKDEDNDFILYPVSKTIDPEALYFSSGNFGGTCEIMYVEVTARIAHLTSSPYDAPPLDLGDISVDSPLNDKLLASGAASYYSYNVAVKATVNGSVIILYPEKSSGDVYYFTNPFYRLTVDSSANTLTLSAVDSSGGSLPPTDTAQAGDVVTWDGENVVWGTQKGGDWKLIKSQTLTEDVDSVRFDFSDAPLRQCRVICKPGAATTSWNPIKINDSVQISTLSVNVPQDDSIMWTVEFYDTVLIRAENGTAKVSNGINGGNVSRAMFNRERDFPGSSNLESFAVVKPELCVSGAYFEVWGIKA